MARATNTRGSAGRSGGRLEGDHLVVPALVHQLGLQPQVPLEGVERAEPAGVHEAATCWFAASCHASRSGSTTSRHSTTIVASLDTFAATSRSSSQVYSRCRPRAALPPGDVEAAGELLDDVLGVAQLRVRRLRVGQGDGQLGVVEVAHEPVVQHRHEADRRRRGDGLARVAAAELGCGGHGVSDLTSSWRWWAGSRAGRPATGSATAACRAWSRGRRTASAASAAAASSGPRSPRSAWCSRGCCPARW